MSQTWRDRTSSSWLQSFFILVCFLHFNVITTTNCFKTVHTPETVCVYHVTEWCSPHSLAVLVQQDGRHLNKFNEFNSSVKHDNVKQFDAGNATSLDSLPIDFVCDLVARQTVACLQRRWSLCRSAVLSPCWYHPVDVVLLGYPPGFLIVLHQCLTHFHNCIH